MKHAVSFAILLLALQAGDVLGLKLTGSLSLEKQVGAADVIFEGVVESVEIVTIRQDSLGVFNRPKLKVRIKRILWPSDAKLPEVVTVTYGYNVDLEDQKRGFLDKAQFFLLRKAGDALFEPCGSGYSFSFTLPMSEEKKLNELIEKQKQKPPTNPK
jgi:hypothetical protein